ncbi:transposable element Tc1 transposase [Trichonephila clavipes]|nr:transposable element Tc1 transposase [Trichonephila clavipes]
MLSSWDIFLTEPSIKMDYFINIVLERNTRSTEMSQPQQAKIPRTLPFPSGLTGPIVSEAELKILICVKKIIGRFKSDGLIENKSGRGSKSILSDVAKRKVLKDIKIDPKPSAVKLTAETSQIMGRSVSAETVRNVIRHAEYSSRVARKKPFIILQNQKKHLEFAKTHQLKTDNFWKKVMFRNESKFNIFGSDGRRSVWRKPNTALDPKNLRPTVKHGGGSVMVWVVWLQMG